MLCHVFWSQVEYKIVCFITIVFPSQHNFGRVIVPPNQQLQQNLIFFKSTKWYLSAKFKHTLEKKKTNKLLERK